MSELVERLLTPETRLSRQTDDILFNVHHLASNIIDKEKGLFLEEAEADVLEQDVSDIAEADVHAYGVVVHQKFDKERGQYVSLGAGTVDHAITGLLEVDTSDTDNLFEFDRRTEEVTDEESVLRPEVNEAMRGGAVKIFVSPSPTHREVDPKVASEFNYDDRTMIRLQTLSKDGQVKTMRSFSLFDVPAHAWANYFGDKFGETIEPTALSVMQFCNRVLLEFENPVRVIEDMLQAVAEYVNPEDKQSVQDQLGDFLNEQERLRQQTYTYAAERLAIQKELALSLGGYATPAVSKAITTVYGQLKEEDQWEINRRNLDNHLLVDDFVAGLVLRIKTVTIDNRAGLATGNKRTVVRFASKLGLEATIGIAEREHAIQQLILSNKDAGFMTRRNEQLIAQSGIGCGGGCSVSVVDLFTEEANIAKKAGLKGEIYESDELDKKSKCHCLKAKVISDGSSVVCTNCGDYEVGGRRGSLGLWAKRTTISAKSKTP